MRFRLIYSLLLCVPAALVLRFLHGPDVALFLVACGGIIPLAGIMGRATEELAKHLGHSIGGLLNATFGNATELIVAGFALHAGYEGIVKASLTGSIIGNLLLVLGLALLCGGWRRERQSFSRHTASVNASMMVLAIGSLVVPAIFGLTHGGMSRSSLHQLSLFLAVILISAYVGALAFSLRTHRSLFGCPAEGESPLWSKRHAVFVLAAATVGVAVLSEFLVRSVEHASETLGLSELFIGVIVVPVIGNAAEHAAAVTMALKDKLDISLNITMGSSTQIALFVAPVLVLLGWLTGRPMTFLFEASELVAVGLSVAIAHVIAQDGETNWFEGAQLVAMYALLAVGFYFVP